MKNFLCKKRYKYTLEKDYTSTVLTDIKFENEWVTIKNRKMTIREGYAWDGCTPSYSIFDLFWIGTPDGVINYETGKPIMYYPSLKHDVFYQFKIGDRITADHQFYLDGYNFMLIKLYYFVVRLIGGMFWRKK